VLIIREHKQKENDDPLKVLIHAQNGFTRHCRWFGTRSLRRR
jgi:hypothetical protein